jgi:hypothetical protein
MTAEDTACTHRISLFYRELNGPALPEAAGETGRPTVYETGSAKV